MTTRWILLGAGCLMAIGFAISGPAPTDAEAQSSDATAASIERGRYLVHEVAMCVQCHSGRDDEGRIDPSKMLHGGPVPMDGPPWIDNWAYHAPDITTFARGRRDYVITVLTTGKRPDGTMPKSPMPPFRLDEEDAKAVVDYLATVR